jgi:hypothetical protein
MTSWPFSHPWILLPAAGLALVALLAGLWAQTRPGQSLRVVGQRPWVLGLGASLILAGLGLGLAEPRWGLPEVPRLTVHVALDASRSMQAADCQGKTRWQAALALLDRLWAQPIPGVRYSLDLLTGDAIPLLPPGEDRTLLRDYLRTVQPGDIGSAGTSFGRALPQVGAQAEPGAPAILLLLSDGEETWERPEAALARASAFLTRAHLPLYTVALGETSPQPVSQSPAAGGASREPLLSRADPALLARLAADTGGRGIAPTEELADLVAALAQGRTPLPNARSIVPARPEWGAWVALAGLGIWLLGVGRPLHRWRPVLLLLLATGGGSLRATIPLPSSVQAWLAQTALDRGDLAAARRWRPTGDRPLHRLVAAQVDLRGQAPQAALQALAPMLGVGVPRPLPSWRIPALLLAARAQMALERPAEARSLLERILTEAPGQAEAMHNLQSLLQDPKPPPPNPRKPPPPPPRPSQGARQDELEGLRKRLPPKPPGGVKDL